MKQNQKLLNAEVNKAKQLIEYEQGTVMSGDLGNNWSTRFHLYKQQGLLAFLKTGYVLKPLNKPMEYKLGTVSGPGDLRVSNGSKLKDVVYMNQEQADELNEIGEQIQWLTTQYNKIFEQYAKE